MKTQIRSLKLLGFLSLIFVINISAQIQTVELPEPGFEERIEKAIDDIWIIDTHEHLAFEEKMLEQKKKGDFDFTHLFKKYIDDDLVSAGYLPMVQHMVNNKNLPLIDRWEILEPFWQATRNTGYARVVIIAARDLYGIKEINSESVEQLSQKINDSYQTGWYKKVLKDNAKIDLSIVDVGHVEPDHEFYYHVERFDRFIYVFSASEINDLGKKYEVEIKNLDDYVVALRKAFRQGLDYGMIGVKSGL